jgi:acyl dehydratase
MKRFNGIDELRAAVGTHLGYSDWIEITQDEVNTFGELTGDRQWIHVDPQRAASGPFGGTIAHGFLTLSLIPRMTSQIYRVDGLKLALNYGLNKVRFPSFVPVGSRVRVGVEIVSVEDTDRGAQSIARITIEREGADKPVCVAESVTVLVA